MRTLGITLLLNLLLWFSVPAIRNVVDHVAGRTVNPHNPIIMTGVQELFVYFDPWLARGIFPAIFLFGFAVIPFLRRTGDAQTAPTNGHAYTIVVSSLLIGLETIWLLLIAVAVVLRGPNWNIFWPWEEFDANKIVPLNNVCLSEYYWLSNPGSHMPEHWLVRELPGLFSIGVYLASGYVLAYILSRKDRHRTPYWRWAALVLMFQVAALIPFKLAARWLFNLKYWIYIPEHLWNL